METFTIYVPSVIMTYFDLHNQYLNPTVEIVDDRIHFKAVLLTIHLHLSSADKMEPGEKMPSRAGN